MKVVFVASEVSPYASTGGLADVAQALPVALTQRGIDTWRMMPFYRQVAESEPTAIDTGIRLKVPMGIRSLTAEIWATTDSEPVTYFIRRDEYFDRSCLYSMPHRDYEDNFERFLFFQKAVVLLIEHLKLQPDIVHCNDWQTGLLPAYLRYGVQGMGRRATEKSVFTIHNLAYQGLYDGPAFSLTNLPFSTFSVDGFEFYGQINCMKAGIIFSDRITTVSKSYADEIQTDEFGCGLNGVLSARRQVLDGIPNGVDYTTWNPETDPHIKRHFTHDNLRGKKQCRQDLAESMGLDLHPGMPLMGMVTRLTEQKGLDLLAEAMEQMMSMEMCFVLLGSGEERYHALCRDWAKRWPGQFSVTLAYDNQLAHRIESGADLFLMPSRFEPCGLNQLYSLRYGTLPIVHAVGGLKDTVSDLPADPEAGNGFVFDVYDTEHLLSAVHSALDTYKKRSFWLSTVKRVMQEDHSWNAAADSYIDIYQRCLSE